MTDIPRGQTYPVLPLRDIVVFPHMIVPLFVGREKSVRALEDVMKEDKQILRSEEHTSELQSLMRISYAVFCLKKKKNTQKKRIQLKVEHTTYNTTSTINSHYKVHIKSIH